jgi:glycosyltransferase involved in cell wall biosynthesis
MRLLVFCHVANNGGISSKTCELAYYLGKEGHNLRVVFFKQRPSHHLLGKIESRVYKRVNPLTLHKEVRNFGPDLVVLAYSSFVGLSSKLADLDVPVVPIVHGQGVRFYSYSPAKRKVLRKMASKIFRSFPMVIVLNKDLEKNVMEMGVPKNRITILRNGVDLERFKPVKKKKEYDLVFAGSLYKEKRLDLLFEALKVFSEGGTPRSLLVLGTGPMEAEWKKLSRSKGIEVKFAGWKRDPWNQYPKAHVFVLSSDSEEFPGAPLEAMACGLPVITTKVGSLPKVIKNGRTGILVEPKDVTGLSEAIGSMLKDRKLREEMGGAARKEMEKRYGWDKVISDYIKIFTKVLKSEK